MKQSYCNHCHRVIHLRKWSALLRLFYVKHVRREMFEAKMACELVEIVVSSRNELFKLWACLLGLLLRIIGV